MISDNNFEVEAEVIGNYRGKPIFFAFNLIAESRKEAETKAENIAVEKFYAEGGHGDDPQIVWLVINGESSR